MINYSSILLGLGMATLDVATFTMIKHVHGGLLKLMWMLVPIGLYALEPVLFLKGLEFQGMAIVNLIWNRASDILVTIVGFLYFKEKIGFYKACGVALSFLAIVLMAMDD
jgi:multidrug transporter EmrE-like cation transporter